MVKILKADRDVYAADIDGKIVMKMGSGAFSPDLTQYNRGEREGVGWGGVSWVGAWLWTEEHWSGLRAVHASCTSKAGRHLLTPPPPAGALL